MLDGVGLIHMGGRVYDPAVGRLLSVDPIVRAVDASQSWNGYGYVEGRTLSWTDPSGWTSAAQIDGTKLEVITVYGRSPSRDLSDRLSLEFFFAGMNRGAGQGGGRDCPEGLEEIVVDGQRSQPPVPVVPLTFVPRSITPPNSARFSRLLNAAEAEYKSCVTKCQGTTGHVTQTLAGAVGGAVTGAVASRMSVPGMIAGAVVGGSVALTTSFLPQNPVSLAYGGAAIGAVGAYAEARHRGGATGPGAIGGAIGEAIGGAIGGRDGAVIGGAAGGIAGSSIAARAAGARGVGVIGIGFTGAVAGAAGGVAYSVARQGFNAIAELYCEAACGH